MVRTIFNPSFPFPVAQYPTAALSGEELYPLVWNIVETLDINELQVMSLTCDSLSANRKFFHISKDIAESVNIPFKTTNPYDQSILSVMFHTS